MSVLSSPLKNKQQKRKLGSLPLGFEGSLLAQPGDSRVGSTQQLPDHCPLDGIVPMGLSHMEVTRW